MHSSSEGFRTNERYKRSNVFRSYLICLLQKILFALYIFKDGLLI